MERERERERKKEKEKVLDNGWLTSQEAAAYCRFTAQTIRRAAATGELEAVKHHGRWRHRWEWLDQWLDGPFGRGDGERA